MENEKMIQEEQNPSEIRFSDEWWKAREDELVYLPEQVRPMIMMGFIRICGSM